MMLFEQVRELLASGDTTELGRLTRELLAQNENNPERLRRLARSLAAMVYEEKGLAARMPLINALAGLGDQQQSLRIEYCHDREEIAAELGRAGQWAELLSLLRSSLLRWQPDTESPADLLWLTKSFRAAKNQCRLLEAELTFQLPGGGTYKTNSKSLMDALVAETLSAESLAWHRCLRGPGGVNFSLANAWVFAETEFAGEFMCLLSQDPAAYIVMVKEAAEHGDKQGLKDILRLENLLQGLQASGYCLTEFLAACLSAAAESGRPESEIIAVLLPAREKLLSLFK